jgi:serine/threonine protein kinase
VGNGQFGYGQDIGAISVVATGGTVTAAQWGTFVQRLNLALIHQSGSAAQLASGSNIGIVAGATISAFANVVTAVDTVNTNKLSFNGIRGATTTGSNLDKAYTDSTTTLTHTITVTFDDADDIAVDLLKKMLVINPLKRVSIEEVLEHPFLKELDNYNDVSLPL